jgi:predicted DNA-binding protein (MmcQ/YjbR family)
MHIEDIQTICRALPGVTEDIKWEHDLVFSIGGKMFCVVGLDESPTSASFKITDEEFEEMSSRLQNPIKVTTRFRSKLTTVFAGELLM